MTVFITAIQVKLLLNVFACLLTLIILGLFIILLLFVIATSFADNTVLLFTLRFPTVCAWRRETPTVAGTSGSVDAPHWRTVPTWASGSRTSLFVRYEWYHAACTVAKRAKYADLSYTFFYELTSDQILMFVFQLRNQTVNGGFGPWTPWQPCNNDDGVDGVSSCLCRSRSCDSPAPRCGGRNCEGPTIEVSNCSR